MGYWLTRWIVAALVVFGSGVQVGVHYAANGLLATIWGGLVVFFCAACIGFAILRR